MYRERERERERERVRGGEGECVRESKKESVHVCDCRLVLHSLLCFDFSSAFFSDSNKIDIPFLPTFLSRNIEKPFPVRAYMYMTKIWQDFNHAKKIFFLYYFSSFIILYSLTI
jgi:hypothetical protein